MAKLEWDLSGQHTYETGVDHAVLYTEWDKTNNKFTKATAWNGITAVTESPSGAESTPLYADNIKYLNLVSAEEFGATVEAYTYPKEFNACLGYSTIIDGMVAGQQSRTIFGLSYRTLIGNDVDPASTAAKLSGGTANQNYKIHLIYNCQAAPSEMAYSTVNDSPEAITFSWEVSTTPVSSTYQNTSTNTASVTIDCSRLTDAQLTALEEILYGSGTTTSTNNGYLPLPNVIAAAIAAAS